MLKINISRFLQNKLIIVLPLFVIVAPAIPVIGNLLNQVYYLLILSLVILELITNPIKHKKIMFFVFFIVFLFLYALMTYPFLGNDMMLTVLKWILSGTALTLGMGVMIDSGNIQKFMTVFSFTCFVTLIVSLVEIGTGWHVVNTIFAEMENNISENYATGFFGNINDLANYLIICLSFCTFYLITEKKKLIKVISIIIMIFIIINSESYLAYLSLICLFTITVVMKIIYNKKFNMEIRIKPKAFLQLIMSSLVLMSFIILFKDHLDDNFMAVVKEINTRLVQLFSSSENDLYVKGRTIILERSFNDFINSNILFGSGIGYAVSTYGMPLHNLFGTFLFEFGLIIFISFIYLLVSMALKLIRIIRYSDTTNKWFNKNFAIVVFSQLAILPITSTIPSEALQRKMIWFIFGFVLICIKNISSSKSLDKD